MEQQEVRALVRNHQPAHRAGYPDEVKRKVVQYAAIRRTHGRGWDDIGVEVGLSSTTLQTWSKSHAQFLPVTIVADEPTPAATPLPTPIPSDGLVLHTPNGYRLCGLDVQQAIALLAVLR